MVATHFQISQSTLDAARARVEVAASHTVPGAGGGSPLTLHVVEGIGAPFDLRSAAPPDPCVTFDAPRPIRVAMLSGKHVDDETLEACLVGLGRQSLRLDADHGLGVFNVELILLAPTARAIYGKVIAVGGGCVVRITSIPADLRARMAAWLP